MSGDVVDRCGRVSCDEQFVGNVNEAQWANEDKQQVPESGDPAWVIACAHVPPCSGAWSRRQAIDTARAVKMFRYAAKIGNLRG